MTEHRGAPRRQVFKVGKIIVSEEAPRLECAVHNISVDGACLQVSGSQVVPARFDLIYDEIRRTCRVAWIKDREVGVMFV